MRCPYCQADDDRVVDSRGAAGGYVIRRRRECANCERRYTTYEKVEETPLKVVKKDGARQPYDREKLARGVKIACQKRPVTDEQIETLVSEVEAEMLGRYDAEVPANALGEMAMERLKQLDPVAYVRFASVYREFKDVAEFARELDAIDGSPA